MVKQIQELGLWDFINESSLKECENEKQYPHGAKVSVNCDFV